MRKDFGAKPLLYPMPVLIIGSYDDAGTPNAMNAAWGSIADTNQIAIYLSASHKTVQNILKRGAYTVSMADAAHVTEADYVGVVSGNDVPDKVARAGLHAVKSPLVDAPLFEEFPLTMECKLLSYDQETELAIGEIVNVSADTHILDDAGKIDPEKLQPITYDVVQQAYRVLGGKVGNAFQDGAKLK